MSLLRGLSTDTHIRTLSTVYNLSAIQRRPAIDSNSIKTLALYTVFCLCLWDLVLRVTATVLFRCCSSLSFYFAHLFLFINWHCESYCSCISSLFFTFEISSVIRGRLSRSFYSHNCVAASATTSPAAPAVSFSLYKANRDPYRIGLSLPGFHLLMKLRENSKFYPTVDRS